MSNSQVIDKTASIDKSIRLPSKIFIGSNVQIRGKVVLGEELWIEPNVIIHGSVEIGFGTYIGSNSIIGFPNKEYLQNIFLKKKMDINLEKEKTARIGKNVLIRSNCVIYSGVNVSNDVRFGHNVLIRENVKIGRESLVGTACVIDGNCEIGCNVSIQTGVYLSTYTTVEDCVFLGPHCVLINDRYEMQKKTKVIGPIIRRGASVGANATIFPEVIVGEGAIIGAASVVLENVPARTIVVGVPAKKLKDVPLDWKTLLKRDT